MVRSEPGPSEHATVSKRPKTEGETVIFAMSSNHYNWLDVHPHALCMFICYVNPCV